MADSRIKEEDIAYIHSLAFKLEFHELQMILKSIDHSKSDCTINVRKRIFKILTVVPRTTLTQELEQKILHWHLSKQKALQYPKKKRIMKVETLLQKYQQNSIRSIAKTSNQTIGFVHNLTFFKTIHSLSEPILCDGNDIGTFDLTKLHHEIENVSNYIRKSWDIRRREFKIQIILRLEQVGQKTAIDGRLPQNICVSVNSSNCELPELIVPITIKKTPWRLNLPIDITRKVNFNKNEQNTFKITWSNVPHTFVAGVFLSEKLTSEDLLVELKRRDLRSSDLSKEFIKNNFDKSVSLTVITLKDPLTTQRLKLPAKGKQCEHLQCFEAIYFLQMNEKKQTWACPICRKQVKFEDLEIDEFFLTILQSSNLSDECENITIFNDGTWTPGKAINYPSANKKIITFIDSGEDDINENFECEVTESTASLVRSNLPNSTNSTNINDCKASTSARRKGNENQEKVKSRPVICVVTLD